MADSQNFGTIFSARSVVGDTLQELGEQYKNVWVVTPDIGQSLKDFHATYPERFIDVGIAEQNSIGVAAGLALEGNIPFVMGMIPFLTMRACEQVRTAVCYQNLPVRIIGTGGGLTSGGGSTHNAMEDIALMKSLVNMTVISIGDPFMVRDILQQSITWDSPMFIRLSQGKKDVVLYEQGKYEFPIGKGHVARTGRDATVFAHGEMVFEALGAAEALASEGINIRVVDMYSIKPFDKELAAAAVIETKNIFVIEDHLMYGGLASVLADFYMDEGFSPKVFKRLGIPQVYAGFGSGPEQRKKYGYDKGALLSSIKGCLK